MVDVLTCPACGNNHLHLSDYSSMMVLGPQVAFFTVVCPTCSARLSALRPIPASLFEDVRVAASRVRAGMGETRA